MCANIHTHTHGMNKYTQVLIWLRDPASLSKVKELPWAISGHQLWVSIYMCVHTYICMCLHTHAYTHTEKNGRKKRDSNLVSLGRCCGSERMNTEISLSVQRHWAAFLTLQQQALSQAEQRHVTSRLSCHRGKLKLSSQRHKGSKRKKTTQRMGTVRRTARKVHGKKAHCWGCWNLSPFMVWTHGP